MEFPLKDWSVLIGSIVLIGCLLFYLTTLEEQPQWNARICFEEYDDCWNVNFLEQQHFVDFCEKGNGWYQISSTTTCILNSETLSMVKP